MTFLLYRHDRSGLDKPGEPAPVPVELMTGHPAIPEGAPMRVLASRVLDDTAGDHELPMWWHRDLNAWAAVTDLHRTGMHDQACALARLLHWCDQGGDCAAHWIYEIRREPLEVSP